MGSQVSVLYETVYDREMQHAYQNVDSKTMQNTVNIKRNVGGSKVRFAWRDPSDVMVNRGRGAVSSADDNKRNNVELDMKTFEVKETLATLEEQREYITNDVMTIVESMTMAANTQCDVEFFAALNVNGEYTAFGDQSSGEDADADFVRELATFTDLNEWTDGVQHTCYLHPTDYRKISYLPIASNEEWNTKNLMAPYRSFTIDNIKFISSNELRHADVTGSGKVAVPAGTRLGFLVEKSKKSVGIGFGKQWDTPRGWQPNENLMYYWLQGLHGVKTIQPKGVARLILK